MKPTARVVGDDYRSVTECRCSRAEAQAARHALINAITTELAMGGVLLPRQNIYQTGKPGQ